MKRRIFLGLLTLVTTATSCATENTWNKPTPALPKPVEMTVYRSASCGCCGKWIDHMKRHGFRILDNETEGMDAIKDKLGVPTALRSCHTAVVAGYVVEGHVPAQDLKKLLRADKPAIAGLAVPGMPIGPPGMEMGGRKDPFAVLGFTKDGKSSIFTDYTSY